MEPIKLEDAQQRLAEIIAQLSPGAEVVILDGDHPVATIRSTPLVSSPKQRQLGALKGSIVYISPDFDSIPDGFEEYVE